METAPDSSLATPEEMIMTTLPSPLSLSTPRGWFSQVFELQSPPLGRSPGRVLGLLGEPRVTQNAHRSDWHGGWLIPFFCVSGTLKRYLFF